MILELFCMELMTVMIICTWFWKKCVDHKAHKKVTKNIYKNQNIYFKKLHKDVARCTQCSLFYIKQGKREKNVADKGVIVIY